MTEFIVRAVLFGIAMGLLYYFGLYRKRDDRLKASLRGAAIGAVVYGLLIYFLDLTVT